MCYKPYPLPYARGRDTLSVRCSRPIYKTWHNKGVIMSEQELKRNVKVYPWYRAFAYDFLFLWTISILYLTEVKGLSYSQVILLDTIFMLSAFLFLLL